MMVVWLWVFEKTICKGFLGFEGLSGTWVFFFVFCRAKRFQVRVCREGKGLEGSRLSVFFVFSFVSGLLAKGFKVRDFIWDSSSIDGGSGPKGTGSRVSVGQCRCQV